MASVARRGPQLVQPRLLLQAQLHGVVGVVVHEALHHLLARPLTAPGSESTRRRRSERTRAGQLHRPADPPAAAGGGIAARPRHRFVDQHADAPAQAARDFDLLSGLTNRRLRCVMRDSCGAGSLRELEELAAMVEREHVAARPIAGGPVVRCRCASVASRRGDVRAWRRGRGSSRSSAGVGIAGRRRDARRRSRRTRWRCARALRECRRAASPVSRPAANASPAPSTLSTSTRRRRWSARRRCARAPRRR